MLLTYQYNCYCYYYVIIGPSKKYELIPTADKLDESTECKGPPTQTTDKTPGSYSTLYYCS